MWFGIVLAAGAAVAFRYCSRSESSKPLVSFQVLDADARNSSGSPSSDTAEPSSVASLPSAAQAPKTVLDFGYGTKEGQLGREKPTEGNPEGPMSFAVTGEGTYVVDQVNERVLRLDKQGKVTARFPASRTTQDIAVAKDGTVALFDRHGKKSVALYDATGRSLGELPLQGPGIAQTGLSTGVFIDGKDVYAEREHGALVRLGSLDGKPGDRKELSGRPSKDGQYLAGAWKGPERGFLYSAFDRSKNQLRFNRSHIPSFPIAQLMLLDTDLRGRMYVGVQASDSSGSPRSEVIVYCFDAIDGHATGRAVYRMSDVADESFKDAVVTDDGTIVFQYRDEAGVHFGETRCSN